MTDSLNIDSLPIVPEEVEDMDVDEVPVVKEGAELSPQQKDILKLHQSSMWGNKIWGTKQEEKKDKSQYKCCDCTVSKAKERLSQWHDLHHWHEVGKNNKIKRSYSDSKIDKRTQLEGDNSTTAAADIKEGKCTRPSVAADVSQL